MHKLIYKVVFLTILLSLSIGCKSKTEVTTKKTDKILQNGKHIKVKKTDKITKHIGILTNINYKTTRQFGYKFTVDRNKIVWKEKGMAEPKQILFCRDSVYVYYLNKIRVPIEKKATDTTKIVRYKYKIKEFHEVYIDKRYFFKLLGEDYWIEITPEQYQKNATECTTYEIPNDKELQLKENPTEEKPKMDENS